MASNCMFIEIYCLDAAEPGNSLYLVPGSASLLKRVCLGSDNLLLIYADRHARLWDVKTREFWRSMGLDKAEELLAQGGWTDL